jgi:hypothetical protein
MQKVKTIIEKLGGFHESVSLQTEAIKATLEGTSGIDFPRHGHFKDIEDRLYDLFTFASSNETFKGMKRDMSLGQVL